MRLTAQRLVMAGLVVQVIASQQSPHGFRRACACVILLLTIFTSSSAADSGNPDPGSRASAVSSAGEICLERQRILQVGQQVMESREFRSVRRHVLQTAERTDPDKGFLRRLMIYLAELVDSGLLYIGDLLRRLLDVFSLDATRPSPPSAAPSASGGVSVPSGVSQIMTILGLMAASAMAMTLAAALLKKRDLRRTRSNPLRNEDDQAAHDSGVAPGEIEVSVWEQRAMLLADEGNFRAAIRELLLGSMSWIERAGLIRYQRGLTSRDYIRALSRSPRQRDSFQITAGQFDRLYFGRKPASQDGFEKCLNGFREAFGESQEPITAG